MAWRSDFDPEQIPVLPVWEPASVPALTTAQQFAAVSVDRIVTAALDIAVDDASGRTHGAGDSSNWPAVNDMYVADSRRAIEAACHDLESRSPAECDQRSVTDRWSAWQDRLSRIDPTWESRAWSEPTLWAFACHAVALCDVDVLPDSPWADGPAVLLHALLPEGDEAFAGGPGLTVNGRPLRLQVATVRCCGALEFGFHLELGDLLLPERLLDRIETVKNWASRFVLADIESDTSSDAGGPKTEAERHARATCQRELDTVVDVMDNALGPAYRISSKLRLRIS